MLYKLGDSVDENPHNQFTSRYHIGQITGIGSPHTILIDETTYLKHRHPISWFPSHQRATRSTGRTLSTSCESARVFGFGQCDTSSDGNKSGPEPDKQDDSSESP